MENRPVPLTERLIIRRMTPDDAEFILALLNDADFLQNIGDRGARTVADAAAYISKGPVASYERHGHGLNLVLLRESNQPIGICGILRREELADVDLGFAFMPAFRGAGYALESAQAVLAHARGVLGFKRVVAIVKPGNDRSIRLLEKLGMRAERSVQLAANEPALLLFG